MRIVFMGTPDFAVPSLHTLIQEGYEVVGVVSQPDRPKGRKRVLTAPPVKEVAQRYNIPILQPNKIKDAPAEMKQIKAWAPDLIVTAAFGQMLPKEVLDLPPLGCINVHASLLPKYRGGAPIQYAIMQGEKETGVSIMYMVEALDAGDVLSQVTVPIEETDDAASLFHKLSQSGATLLKETLTLFEEGKLKPIPQDESKVTYAPTIKREDEEIDWTQEGQTIYNHIRGLHPLPGSFTRLDGQIFKVWMSSKATDQSLKGDPGTVYRLDEEGIGVIAGDQTGIMITQIQPAGKKKMNAADFLRGAGSGWSVGIKLGE